MAPAAAAAEGQEELPLDVAYTKLLDWLVERRLLKPTWQDALKAVRGQLEAALRELPEGVAEIGSLMKGKSQLLHYYQCKRIMELLEAAQEGRVRNFFGSYTTPLLRAWAAVLRAYERDNVYLGEAGRLLVQQGVYTCPGLRRAIAQLEKQIGDGSRKAAECERTGHEIEHRFREACQELQIPLPAPAEAEAEAEATAALAYEAIDFRAALAARTAELPALFAEVEALAREEAVGEALGYHGDVRRFLLHAHAEGKEGDEESSDPPMSFPVLCRVRSGERGPGLVEPPEPPVGASEEVLEIDWDAAMAGDATAVSGGGGSSAAAEAAAAVGEIDWGGGGDGGGVEWGQEGAAAPVEIDWAIEVEEAGAEGGGVGAVEASTESAAAAGGAGAGGAAPLLADAGQRSELLNDLLELQGFLKQRRLELADAEGGLAFVGQYQGPHAALQQQSLGAVDKYLEAVAAVVAALRSSRLQSLLMIQASSAYLDRVVAGLRQKLEHMAKMRRAKAEAEARREEAIAELGKAVPEYEATASATKVLRAQVEQSLTTLLKGRRVHIMGDINTL